ncbi:MAG: hypothetical protein R3250_10640 [Melioribacteraceae bacterium]|nr:hypothetical protein [Melioribacteraceae bacterium]
MRIFLQLTILALFTQIAYGQNRIVSDLNVVGNYYEERTLTINVSVSGQDIYSVIKILPPHYSIPKADILENGNLILAHSLEGIVEIYNKTGNIIFRDEYYKLPPYRGQKLKYEVWSEGFIIVVSEEGTNTLHNLNNDGDILLDKDLEQGMISGIKLSPNGDLFVYSVVDWIQNELYTTTNILSLNGNYFQSILKNFENGVFSTNSNLFVGWENRNIFCVDLLNRRIIWERSLENNQLISDAIIEGSDTYILFSSNPLFIEKEWQYDNIRIISKNLSGDEKHLFQFPLIANTIKFNTEGEEPILVVDGKEFKFNED